MARSRNRGSRSRNQVIRAAWRASRPGLVAVGIFSAFINVLKFSVPLYMLHAFDRVPASRSIETLVMLTLIVIVAVIAGLALEVVRRRMLSRWGIWIEQQFGVRLLHASLANRSTSDTPTAPEALGELVNLRSFVTRSAASWLDVVWAPLFFFGIYLIHPMLGAVGVATIVILLLIGPLQDLITRGTRRASRQAESAADRIVAGAERNIETVGALTMSTSLTERWRRSNIAHLEERDRSEANIALFRTMMRGLGQCFRIALIGVGIWLFLQNEATLGGIFAARMMGGFGYALAERAVRDWRALKEAGVSYQRVKQLLSEESERETSVAETTSESELIVDSVSFKYYGRRDYVVRRLSIEVGRGELLLIIGDAATGKTTLSRLLIGLLQPQYGQIRLGDVDVWRLPPEMRAQLIGYLPQHTELFHGTVRENIARMGEGNFSDVLAAAKLANIHDTIIRLPQGYDTEISEDTTGLSGSERKRIALARAIYGTPRVLVLDEPAANLDRPSRRAMETAIVELKRAGTSIVMTQTAPSVRSSRIADKFLTLGGKEPEISVAAGANDVPGRPGSAELRAVK
jgi:ATP-binding cassette, subfamily C, bacterial exporter for protease/lipase